jgi:F0F1-type ATP synthase gamma subunit
VGDKAKAQLKAYKNNIQLSVNKLAKNGPNFLEAGSVAESVLESKAPFVIGSIFYNSFKSVIAYETTQVPFYTKESIAGSGNESASSAHYPMD